MGSGHAKHADARTPTTLRVVDWIARRPAMDHVRRLGPIFSALLRWVIAPLAILGATVGAIGAFAQGRVIVGVLLVPAVLALCFVAGWGTFGWFRRDREF